MFQKFAKSEEGFTLIELLIVVAIIGILAAVAIPQFAAYRQRGYNSAASSDLRNIKVQTEAFQTEWQIYASSAAAGAAGLGTLVPGPANTTVTVAAGAAGGGLPSASADFSFGVSNGVTAVVNTDAQYASYVIQTSHRQGTESYAADSDETSLMRLQGKTPGTAMVDADRIPSVIATNDPLAKGYINL